MLPIDATEGRRTALGGGDGLEHNRILGKELVKLYSGNRIGSGHFGQSTAASCGRPGVEAGGHHECLRRLPYVRCYRCRPRWASSASAVLAKSGVDVVGRLGDRPEMDTQIGGLTDGRACDVLRRAALIACCRRSGRNRCPRSEDSGPEPLKAISKSKFDPGLREARVVGGRRWLAQGQSRQNTSGLAQPIAPANQPTTSWHLTLRRSPSPEISVVATESVDKHLNNTRGILR